MSSEVFPPVFWELHEGLPRQGPGDDASTARALAAALPLPAVPSVADVGCGPGMQTLVLARELGCRVVAIDNHEPFLVELRERAARAGLAHLVEARSGDMERLPFEAGSLDLLWCEGALYILGFDRGLALWRPLLRPRGVLVVSEAAWLRPDAPEELRRFWEQGYPGMGSREENLVRAGRLGYRVREHFVLPEASWWTHYYAPLEARLAVLRARHAGDAAALAFLDEEAREIDLFRAYHEHYGYVFYVLERTD